MARPHPGNGQRRALSVWRNGRTFFFVRGHWMCPWVCDYFTIYRVPEPGYNGPSEVEFFRMPTKPELRSSAAGQLRAADPGLMLGEWPRVQSMLVDLVYDGTTDSRLPGTLMVRPGAGQWLLILKDPSSALQIRVQAGTLEDALTALELMLESPDCPWEHDPYAPKVTHKKRK